MLLLFLILDIYVREIYSHAYYVSMEMLYFRQSLWIVTLVSMFWIVFWEILQLYNNIITPFGE